MTNSSHPASTILRNSVANVAPRGKKIIGPPSVQAHTGNGHQVNVQHNSEGAIETIEIVCDCGQRILLRCNYE